MSKKGVEWKFASTVGRLDDEKDRVRVNLSTGEQFETDVVISAAGLEVNTEVAAKAGLDTGRGILTNRLMQTSDADIFSIGDCAEVDGEIYAYIEPIRRQAQVIAANLFGGEKSFESKSPLIRVKTPSFPLSLCLPGAALKKQAQKIQVDDSRTEFFVDDKLVGFILTGKQVSGASEMYRKVNQ
jgi:rubredoxin-NAD+ reductase